LQLHDEKLQLLISILPVVTPFFNYPYIPPPDPLVLSHDIKLLLSLIVNIPLILIVKYIPPPFYPLHLFIYIPIISTSPKSSICKLIPPPSPPLVLIFINCTPSLIVNFYAIAPPIVPFIILALLLDVIAYEALPNLVSLPLISTSPVPLPIFIRSSFKLIIDPVIN
jgi:hypothetical protein